MKMTKNSKQKPARLELVLDIYGPDKMRWPADERAELTSLFETDPQARRLYAEAKALSHAMNAVPKVSASDDLKARIAAAAANDPTHEAKVVPISTGRNRSVGSHVPDPFAPVWPAAALAASFALGLYLGIAGVGSPAVEGAMHVSGLAGTGTDTDGIIWLEDGADSEGVL